MLKTNSQDSGSYILILRLRKAREISIGKLGSFRFNKGYYLYVGSAERGLSKRIERHKKKRKKFFWHIDYLRAQAIFDEAILFHTSQNLECKLASKLKEFADWSVPDFGSSDCHCESHLFATKFNPMPSLMETIYGINSDNSIEFSCGDETSR